MISLNSILLVKIVYVILINPGIVDCLLYLNIRSYISVSTFFCTSYFNLNQRKNIFCSKFLVLSVDSFETPVKLLLSNNISNDLFNIHLSNQSKITSQLLYLKFSAQFLICSRILLVVTTCAWKEIILPIVPPL